MLFFFFFSSRRRHTRLTCDWSSDVCSSDLSANSRLFASIGLISAAVFSDVNGDGWPDLILAPEWGSLKLFLNDHGRFRDATAEYQLDRVIGRWNGVTTGDLDGDD